MTTATATGIYAKRIAAADWEGVARELDAYGCALLPRLLTPDECARIAVLYDQPPCIWAVTTCVPAERRRTRDLSEYRDSLRQMGTLGAFVGKTAVKDGKGVMVESVYRKGSDYLPSDAEVEKMRPKE